MSRASSPSAAGRYGTARVCRVWEVPRSTVYARRARASRTAQPAAKRGPKQAWTDAVLTEQIRSVLAGSPFIGEGYRKAWARLRLAGVRTSRGRVLRLMREAGLLAPTRVGRRRGPRNHDGMITTGHPDEMWGTDATACLTTREGNATVFIAVDHCTQEYVGIHAARPGTRFEALEPLRQGLRAHHGGYGPGVAAGLSLRHDHGSQYLNDHFQGELRFLGIRSSPSFVAAPEGNGCAERFIRTLKEQLLWVEPFETVQQLRLRCSRSRTATTRSGWSSATATAPRPPSARRSRRAPKRLHDYRLRGVQESGSGTQRTKPQQPSRLSQPVLSPKIYRRFRISSRAQPQLVAVEHDPWARSADTTKALMHRRARGAWARSAAVDGWRAGKDSNPRPSDPKKDGHLWPPH